MLHWSWRLQLSTQVAVAPRGFGSLVSAGLAVALLVIAPPAEAQRASQPNIWQARTVSDLDAARKIIFDHSPAAVDPDNPAMRAWHEAGYQGALERARTVNSEEGWRYTLLAFVHGYGDPHLSFDPDSPAPQAREPGFIVSALNGVATVSWVRSPTFESPRVGDVVTSCDGLTIPALLEQRVFPFSLFRQFPGDQRRAVSRLFLDRNNPFAPAPRACAFNSQPEQMLHWQAVAEADQDFWTRMTIAGLGPRAAGGLSEPAAGVAWIGVPSFAPVGAGSSQLDGAISAFAAAGDRFRAGRAIVIDLRGNSGGSSMLGDRLATAIWGADAVAIAKQASPPTAVDWRASRENAQHVSLGAMFLSVRFPDNPAGRLWRREVVPGLRRAVINGLPFHREGPASVPQAWGPEPPRVRGPSPFPAKVFVLVNGTCASACLDFADIAFNIPGTVHIGESTAGDGLLMELRAIKLPSGRGSIQTPIKVVRGGPRAAMQVYDPDIRYSGPWDDASVRQWVLETIG